MASSSSTRLTRTLLSPRWAQTRWLCNSTARHDSSSRQPPSHAEGGLTGSDKLLADALRLEAEEEAALSKTSRQPDPNDPIWTGEERVQDTVLRMVMDKYKPLRIPRASDEGNAADEKIKNGIQTPSTPFTESTTGDDEETFRMYLPPGKAGAHEDGRKLPKTPNAKPWRAVYVRPAHLLGGNAEEEFKPSIYYGQFIKSHNSDVRGKLQAAGVNVGVMDDPKKLSALRQGLKVAERRGKLLRARESVLDYQLRSSSSPSSSDPDDHTDQAQELKGDELSDTNRNLQLQLGHAQGWDSVIERRIKAALDSGAFKENKLRGKPIQRDMEEKNPFLAREEYFMNRIVKRQGAAPPWVELNMELETELAGWRGRFDEGWVRRASRMIITSSLRDGLEPLPLTSHSAEAIPPARTTGEARLVEVATRYRDAEWETRERSYHAHEVKRLNDLVRRHNHLAPFTARKGLMVLDVELAAMYKRTLPKLVYEVSRLLTQQTTGEGARKEGWDAGVERGGVVSYDMWGREVRQDAGKIEAKERERWLDGWLGNGVSGGGEAKAGEGGEARSGDAGRDEGVQKLGLVEAIQKSLAWARERLVRA
ncbi:DnaJ, subfamily C [Kalmanozyma brasiliensis GHG001]|uniref:DnaJ homologue subfamily C member 28 conserved domain-containing protein n=1 Tax=Kalmanozyma brasiliensis (strain GHG001) TaxID=1365824 RepID=V5EEF9_KALBG|nr:DnaJ, subfamily C [Kalmanozyma brasiliensis GHG001]EST08886.1 DnaJ, subfamily C [Kalmanozyma brasiliensis GHG001]